jgi:hypothetical protein
MAEIEKEKLFLSFFTHKFLNNKTTLKTLSLE